MCSTRRKGNPMAENKLQEQKQKKTMIAFMTNPFPQKNSQSQRFRDLTSNRKEARKLLAQKLDELQNGALSKRAVRIALEQKRKKRSAQKTKKKKGSLEAAGADNDDAGSDEQGGDTGDQGREEPHQPESSSASPPGSSKV